VVKYLSLYSYIACYIHEYKVYIQILYDGGVVVKSVFLHSLLYSQG
jgi:hypothetical protein